MKPVSASLLALLLGAGCARFSRPSPAQTLQITAKKYSFQPAVIHVKKGSQVVLEISTLDVQHGFQVPGLGINESIQKGRPTMVSFTAPDKAGEYKLECNIICGPGHENMEGKIVVE
jgi:cytochrome c oxidase subunit II